jgi:HEXXH motif-containing protein
MGTAVLNGEPDGPVLINVLRGKATLVGPSGVKVTLIPDVNWHPMRRLRAVSRGGLVFDVRLDDAHPARDGYHAPPSERLTAGEADRWQHLFAEAWDLISGYLPERAVELAAGVQVIVPLQDNGDGSARSGTARDSIGAMGMTMPRSAADFAVTLVHEYQHSKLSAVLDLVPLYVPDGTERHFAPWRNERRPTSGLIQGVYAFLAVVGAWRDLHAAPGLARIAALNFAELRDQVVAGFASLASSAELTPAGLSFVAGMRPALDRLAAGTLSAESPTQAASLTKRQRSD